MTRRTAPLLVLLAAAACATTAGHPRPDDWLAHEVCGTDTRPGRGEPYCLEVIELTEEPEKRRAVAVLVPGMFQNARVWDVLPEEGISFARWLVHEEGLKVYIVHVRGIARSDYPPRSNLDDIAIDDLPLALRFVSEREGEPVIAMGHSQGGITLQGSLSGLTRCPDGPCFDPDVARARQGRVRSLGLFAGDLGLSGEGELLPAFTCAMTALVRPLSGFVDHLPTAGVAPLGYKLGSPVAWSTLVVHEDVRPEAIQALFERSVDSSSTGIGLQLADGVGQGIRTARGELYADHLGNLQVPVIQTTFTEDPLSEPASTWRDDFSRIGSKRKKFKRVVGQAHEDFLLDPRLHRQHAVTVDELVRGLRPAGEPPPERTADRR